MILLLRLILFDARWLFDGSQGEFFVLFSLHLFSFSEFVFNFFVEFFFINESIVHDLLFFKILSIYEDGSDLFISFVNFCVHLIVKNEIPACFQYWLGFEKFVAFECT